VLFREVQPFLYLKEDNENIGGKRIKESLDKRY
jgi:hypothetical protein